MKSLQIPNPNSLPIFIWGVLFLMVVTPNHPLLLQLRPEIPVISTYNPIYRIYNPIYNQLSLIYGHNCRIFHGKPSIFMIPLWKSPDVFFASCGQGRLDEQQQRRIGPGAQDFWKTWTRAKTRNIFRPPICVYWFGLTPGIIL